MGNDRGVIKRPRSAVKQQFLGRHGHHSDAAILGNALDLHIVQHWRWHRHRLARHRVDGGHLHLVNVWVWVGNHNLDLRVRLLHHHLQGLLVQAGVIVNLDFLVISPVKLGNPALPDQRILKNGVSGQETAVVVLENVIYIVGGLLRRLHILWPPRHKLDHILRREKHFHQAGQHGADSVAHLHRHHLAVALDLVAEQVASVVLSPPRTGWRQVAVHIADGIRQVLRDDRLQFRIVHRLGGCNVGG